MNFAENKGTMDYPDNTLDTIQCSLAKMLEFRHLTNKEGMFKHQEFVRRYLSPYTPYNFLVLYHKLGSGKTHACLRVAEDHYKHSYRKTIIITKGDSARNNFKEQIKKFNINIQAHFYNYRQLANRIAKTPEEDMHHIFSDSIVIMDEVHNLKISDKDESTINWLVTAIHKSKNSKFMYTTGTPMINETSELKMLLKLCCRNDENFNGIISFTDTEINKPEYSMEVIYSTLGKYQEKKYETVQRMDDVYKHETHICLFVSSTGKTGVDLEEEFFEPPENVNIQSDSVKKIQISRPKASQLYRLKGDELEKSSGKYAKLMEMINDAVGKVFIFVEDVIGPGITILRAILSAHGYQESYGIELSRTARFTICTGNTLECPNNLERIQLFNSESNIDGDYVKVLIGSRTVGEAINLYGVNDFHYITPHWNFHLFVQSFGRVIRENSHEGNDRKYVKAYFHLATSHTRETVDIKKYKTAIRKEEDIKFSENYLKSVAVDRYCYDEVDYNTLDPLTFYSHRMDTIYSEDLLFAEQYTDLNHAVARYVMVNNIKVKNMYVRCNENGYFLTNDISLPFYALTRYKTIINTENSFESLPYEGKIRYLESCIQHNCNLDELHSLYIFHNNAYYHIMGYRSDLTYAYNALIPIVKSPSGPMRCFSNGIWQDTADDYVCELYREKLEKIQLYISETFPVFGYRSVIDNDFRLKGSVNSEDRRKTQRGLSLKSFDRSHILNIFSPYIYDLEKHNKNGIIQAVEEFLKENKLYVWM